jgi:hypothetical protein
METKRLTFFDVNLNAASEQKWIAVGKYVYEK